MTSFETFYAENRLSAIGFAIGTILMAFAIATIVPGAILVNNAKLFSVGLGIIYISALCNYFNHPSWDSLSDFKSR